MVLAASIDQRSREATSAPTQHIALQHGCSSTVEQHSQTISALESH
eukprot:SAG11_NODE_36272_length_262_cov_0.957055_1_plen_45_part_10